MYDKSKNFSKNTKSPVMFNVMKPLEFNSSYLFNQVNCILSLDLNRQHDYRNVSELFSTYT